MICAERSERQENLVKIGLDVVPLSYPPSGVRVYVEALIDAFRFCDAGVDLAPLAPLSGLIRGSNRLARLDWDLRTIASAARNARVDLLHMTRFAAPLRCDRPFVVTVHDLIPLQLPEYRASRPARIQADLARRTVPRATRIIVPSRYVAHQVTTMLGIPPERVDVIPMGVAIPVRSGALPSVSGPYVLHTGGFDVRKNLPVLLRAFARALPELAPDWRLVLLGAPHSGNPAVYPPVWPEIERLRLTDRVVVTGRVGEREKHALYQHATLVVAPSLNEGFGLPILEAMAHGIPVIASQRTSHPEVAGDAAILVQPEEEALAGALVSLADDPGLRADLSRRGLRRAAEFSWSRTAASTLATYRAVLQE